MQPQPNNPTKKKGKQMTIYNATFVANFGNDIKTEVHSFKTREEARKCLKSAIADELLGYCYDDEEVKERLVQEEDSFAFFEDSMHDTWKFIGIIHTDEL